MAGRTVRVGVSVALKSSPSFLLEKKHAESGWSFWAVGSAVGSAVVSSSLAFWPEEKSVTWRSFATSVFVAEAEAEAGQHALAC